MTRFLYESKVDLSNQSGHPVNARSCEHIKTILAEEHEDAVSRPRWDCRSCRKGKTASKATPASKAKPSSKAKSAIKGKTIAQTKVGRKRKKIDWGEDEEGWVEEEQQVEEEAFKPAVKKARISSVNEDDEDEDAAVDQTGNEEIGSVVLVIIFVGCSLIFPLLFSSLGCFHAAFLVLPISILTTNSLLSETLPCLFHPPSYSGTGVNDHHQ